MMNLICRLKGAFALFAALFLCSVSAICQIYDKDTDNAVGDSAVDFSFSTADTVQSLYGLLQERNTNILIVFHSPDCEVCAKTKRKLAKSKRVNELLERGELTVLALAVETDRAKWEATCATLPELWVNAYCEDCEAVTSSYIWTVPTLFLIGRDGKVLDREFKHNEKNRYN